MMGVAQAEVFEEVAVSVESLSTMSQAMSHGLTMSQTMRHGLAWSRGGGG